MTAASLTIPAKFSALNSQRVPTLRKFWSHANRRSIFHRLLYRRNSLPSWVTAFTLFFRCGEIIAMCRFLKRASNLSSSYALSPTIRLGCLRRKRLSRVRSTSFASWREALSICTAIGRPWLSAIAMILVPFPRFVGPINRPPFLPPKRWHQ
jgi:hypothetical protein